MKSPPFEYLSAATVAEACSALAGDEEARALAGGQSLVPLMNLRLARPSLLVDLNGLSELDYMERRNGDVAFGSMCRHRRLETDPSVAIEAPLLSRAAARIGHPQIRNRGTLGGSLAHADPSGELPAAVIALGGQIRLTGPVAERTIPASEFFSGFFTTAIGRGEVLTEITVPRRHEGDGFAFVEFAPRHGDFAVVGVGAWTRLEGAGSCEIARAAACGVSSTPVDLSPSLVDLVGSAELGEDSLRAIAGHAGSLFEPTEDLHASRDDRRELLQLLLVEALRDAWREAKGGLAP